MLICICIYLNPSLKSSGNSQYNAVAASEIKKIYIYHANIQKTFLNTKETETWE